MWGLLEILLLAMLITFFIVLYRVRGRKSNNVETLIRKRVRLTKGEAQLLAANLSDIAMSNDADAPSEYDLKRKETEFEIITFEVQK